MRTTRIVCTPSPVSTIARVGVGVRADGTETTGTGDRALVDPCPAFAGE